MEYKKKNNGNGKLGWKKSWRLDIEEYEKSGDGLIHIQKDTLVKIIENALTRDRIYFRIAEKHEMEYLIMKRSLIGSKRYKRLLAEHNRSFETIRKI